mmetsp:Transcript_78622/g.155741  ORF Transcript_78622/g.155741 Transcript_78622/m.155741 type:complete len:89 (+) Transcript_78622:342-608(+)
MRAAREQVSTPLQVVPSLALMPKILMWRLLGADLEKEATGNHIRIDHNCWSCSDARTQEQQLRPEELCLACGDWAQISNQNVGNCQSF